VKCCEIHIQKIACKKLSLNADNEIKRTMNKYKVNEPDQTTLKYESFGPKLQVFWWLVNTPLFLFKWWAFSCIWYNLAFKSWNSLKIRKCNKTYVNTFAQYWKTKLRKTKLQRYSHIGPACTKGLENERTKVYQDYSHTYEELFIGTLNSTFICAWWRWKVRLQNQRKHR